MKYDKFNISVEKIYKAINFYGDKGYEMLDVPMICSSDSCNVTKPEGNESFNHDNDSYVGSAEQSFIELYSCGQLPDGKFMALTPCYRDEPEINDLHLNIFLKLELIHVGDKFVNENQIIKDSFEFFSIYGQPIVTKESYVTDININDIEVGSYGTRAFPDGKVYVFGTGIAEPRLSYSLMQNNQ